jgi:putative hydrolase
MEFQPAEALKRIATLLEAAAEPAYHTRAFRRAAASVEALDIARLRDLALQGRLQELSGVGDVTERVIVEALAGETPSYLKRLEEKGASSAEPAVKALLAALRGDCHVHSDWSDGGATIEEMAQAGMALGRDYIVLTDHSPRLTIAKGLSAERLRSQLDVVDALNKQVAPFRWTFSKTVVSTRKRSC